jgi:uncharacterized phage infection (PIP) family protein YhgE
MDNEKFQDLMLDHFAKILKELQDVKGNQGRTDSRLANVESGLTSVDSRLTNVESGLTSVDSRLTTMDSRLTNVESGLSEVRQSQVRMEAEVGRKLDVLYTDWRESQKQFNDEVRSELKILGTKVEALQMESTKHEQEIRDLYLVKVSKE